MVAGRHACGGRAGGASGRADQTGAAGSARAGDALFVGRTRASLEKADLSVLETEAEKRADLTATMDSDAIYENVLPGLSVRYNPARPRRSRRT